MHARVACEQKGEAFGLVVISESDNQPLLVHRILPTDNFSLQNGTWQKFEDVVQSRTSESVGRDDG